VTETLGPDHRYTVISADAHAGADIPDYRPYLAEPWHRDFDAWAASYVNPFADLLAPTAYRSWDSDRRLAENDADGITAEVLFPNTVPPFFEEGSLVALPPTESEYDRRWAGIQAHNRWLADFCAQAPGRRAGVVQIFANRIDDALAEVRWAASTFSPFGGILLPSLPPGSALPPLWDLAYEPLWSLCEELGVVVNIHGGGGLPDYGDAEVARAIMLVELPWFSHRSVWHLIFGGIFERHPALQVVLTEQGLAWLPRGLETLDWFYGRMTLGRRGRGQLLRCRGQRPCRMTPTEYFQSELPCRWAPASCEPPSRPSVTTSAWSGSCGAPTTPTPRGAIPFSTRGACGPPSASCDPVETAADGRGRMPPICYGFDLDDAPTQVGHEIGPTVAEVATPLPVEALPGRLHLQRLRPPPGAALLVVTSGPTGRPSARRRAARTPARHHRALRPFGRIAPLGGDPGREESGEGPMLRGDRLEGGQVEAVHLGRGQPPSISAVSSTGTSPKSEESLAAVLGQLPSGWG
jgi:predicted TIM-barrel fold metal-dependent hydrolase